MAKLFFNYDGHPGLNLGVQAGKFQKYYAEYCIIHIVAPGAKHRVKINIKKHMESQKNFMHRIRFRMNVHEISVLRSMNLLTTYMAFK